MLILALLDEHSNEVERSRFFEELGSGSPSTIAPEASGGDDLEFERETEVSQYSF